MDGETVLNVDGDEDISSPRGQLQKVVDESQSVQVPIDAVNMEEGKDVTIPGDETDDLKVIQDRQQTLDQKKSQLAPAVDEKVKEEIGGDDANRMEDLKDVQDSQYIPDQKKSQQAPVETSGEDSTAPVVEMKKLKLVRFVDENVEGDAANESETTRLDGNCEPSLKESADAQDGNGVPAVEEDEESSDEEDEYAYGYDSYGSSSDDTEIFDD